MAFRLWPIVCKLIQRQTYTCLSTRYGVWFAFLGICMILISAFHFGEVFLKWSMIRYAGNFHVSRYYDNIGSKSFETRLCLPQPIDVVYTWVNGSDPLLVTQLNKIKKELKEEFNRTSHNLYSSQKKRGKLINSEIFKWKEAHICPFPNCVQANKLAVSGLPRHTSLFQVKKINTLFSSANRVEFWDEDLEIAFVQFGSNENVLKLLNKTCSYKNIVLNISEVFYTSTIKRGHKRIKTSLMLYDITKNNKEDGIKTLINSKLPNAVVSVKLYSKEKLALLHLSDEDFVQRVKALSKTNLTFNEDTPRLFPVTYVWKPVTLTIDNQDEDFSSNRFADNSELKYSLRSVEKFAPWVRKIFLVTNGQIPKWLDLDHPRISLVTHEDLFVNKSHLPTFSSPAIESHIHRIPGLSKKFIYMNDDVFFGAEVWPDDFFTHSKGHKIYLSWAVPNCREGCPASWINDKYCDKACNFSSCDWDGGDCIGKQNKKSYLLQTRNAENLYNIRLNDYCAPGCAVNWVGDRYCDGNCNHLPCAFDGGDCGTQNFFLLFSHTFTEDVFQGKNAAIIAPQGTLSMYLNFTNIFHSVIDGNFEDSSVLRNAVLSKKFKVLSLTFYKNVTETMVALQVLGYRGVNNTDKTVAFFKINVSTVAVEEAKEVSKENSSQVPAEKEIIPKSLYSNKDKFEYDSKQKENIHDYPSNIFNLTIPQQFQEKLHRIQEDFRKGDLTGYGFNRSVGLLYQEYTRLENKVQNPGRKLLWIDGKTRSMINPEKDQKSLDEVSSFLPWERGNVGKQLLDISEHLETLLSYKIQDARLKRHLLDAFSSSLLHVSRIYNKAFGYKARKVPAHMPHMVDRDIIYEMQQRFWMHFDETSSHKLRHPEDMQFAFAFNYYVIGVKEATNISVLFNLVDTDDSGVLSDRELRTLTAILYPLPLSLKEINDLENKLKACSQRLGNPAGNTSALPNEKYFDPEMPVVTKKLFLNCHEVWRMLNKSQEKEKYKNEIMGEEDLSFKMIRNNVTQVLHQLDWIRKNQRKFICINDDLDHDREDSKLVRKILKDFYEALFPKPSQFELKRNLRNRFLYKNNLEVWTKDKELKTKENNLFAIVFIIAIVLVLCRKRLTYICKTIFRTFFNQGNRRFDAADFAI